MILIVAGCIGLAVARFAIEFAWRDIVAVRVPSLRTLAGWKHFLFGPNQLALNATRFFNLILLQFLPWLILAVILIRLRRPRPSRGALFRQPGFVACVAPTLAFCAASLLSMIRVPVAVCLVLLVSAGPLAWLVLWATRRWMVEPGWIDRLGRIVGLTFMVSSIALTTLAQL